MPDFFSETDPTALKVPNIWFNSVFLSATNWLYIKYAIFLPSLSMTLEIWIGSFTILDLTRVMLLARARWCSKARHRSDVQFPFTFRFRACISQPSCGVGSSF